MNLNNLQISHRGIHDNIKIPENSLLAFKEAIKNNFAIELDVQLTKDNVLIVFHDNNLKRMTNYDKNIKDLTYNEIKEFNLLDTKEKIPTLKEALELVNGKVLLDIEIKKTKKIKLIIKNISEILNNYNYKFLIKSFSPKIVRCLKKHNKNYKIGLLIKHNFYNGIIGRLILNYCKPDFLAISKKYIKTNGINSKLKEYPILIWTIKTKEEFNFYKKYNGIICNNLPFDKY